MTQIMQTIHLKECSSSNTRNKNENNTHSPEK